MEKRGRRHASFPVLVHRLRLPARLVPGRIRCGLRGLTGRHWRQSGSGSRRCLRGSCGGNAEPIEGARRIKRLPFHCPHPPKYLLGLQEEHVCGEQHVSDPRPAWQCCCTRPPRRPRLLAGEAVRDEMVSYARPGGPQLGPVEATPVVTLGSRAGGAVWIEGSGGSHYFRRTR